MALSIDGIGAVLDCELRLEGRRDAPGEKVLLGLGRQRRKRCEPLRRRQRQPIEAERLFARFEQPVGRRAGEIVDELASRVSPARRSSGWERQPWSRQIDAQGIERQVERHPEIAGKMRLARSAAGAP